MLISVAYLIPLAVLVVNLQKSIYANISFARQETNGNRYQRPLEKLLQGIGEHRAARSADDATRSAVGLG